MICQLDVIELGTGCPFRNANVLSATFFQILNFKLPWMSFFIYFDISMSYLALKVIIWIRLGFRSHSIALRDSKWSRIILRSWKSSLSKICLKKWNTDVICMGKWYTVTRLHGNRFQWAQVWGICRDVIS